MALVFVYPAIYPCICLPPAVSVTATFDLESKPSLDLTVSKTGAGSGTIASNPPGIDCGSTCTAGYEEGSTVKLTATAEPGSEFREWNGACSGSSVTCEVTMSEAKSVSAQFTVVSAPFTAKRVKVLTLTKLGAGSVKSKPKGIACGSACTSTVGQFYKGTTVVLYAKAVTGGALEGWEGCDSSTNTGVEGTCTVAMSEARNVEATFKAPATPLVNPQLLTLIKAGSGAGTVKATGLVCEAACVSTEVEYTGGEGKKLPATVMLTEIPASGSEFIGWEGCESEPEGKCVVLMSKAQSVTARFDAKPTLALALSKSGAGAVKSKPKGISCGNACISAVAGLSEDTVIVLTAKAMTGGSLEGWEGCDSSVNTGLEGTCTVMMNEAKSVKATFAPPAKLLVNPQTLTLIKTGTGTGTIKGTSLVCEAACASTQVEYFGGVAEPKPITATMVTLTAMPSAGSEFAGWEGCESEPEGKCVVSMSSAQEVTAKFE